MSDFAEHANRIAAALDRIGSGVDLLGGATDEAGPRQSGESDALREALEAERNANAQLEERVLAIKEKQEKVVARLEGDMAALQAEADNMSAELAQLRALNTQLRENNQALRAANAQGVGDASLINSALDTELAALETRRAADRAELDAILKELAPLVEEQTHA